MHFFFFFLLSFCLSLLFGEENGSSYTYTHYNMDHHNAGLKYNLVTFAAANFDDYKMFDGVGFYFILFFWYW